MVEKAYQAISSSEGGGELGDREVVEDSVMIFSTIVALFQGVAGGVEGVAVGAVSDVVCTLAKADRIVRMEGVP
jgi:hypothetical protein